MSDITIDTDPTTDIDHADSKGFQLDRGRYNRAARGYCHIRLPNGSRCLNRSLWYLHDSFIQFGRSNYYCKHNVSDCFA